MPYVASIGTHVPCDTAVRTAPARLVTMPVRRLDTDRTVSRDCRWGAQISLVHNVFRSTAGSAPESARTTGEGATYGAW